MLSPAEVNFESHDPARFLFGNMMERAVTLSYGSLFEQLHDEGQRTTLRASGLPSAPR